MKKNYTLLLFCFLFSIGTFSQKTEEDYAGGKPKKEEAPLKKGFDADKLTFGGNVAASFGQTTIIQIAPQVGYRVTDRFIPGLGLNYIYYDDLYGNSSIYGGSIFARYLIANNFFVHAEYETLSRGYYEPGVRDRQWVPIGLVGGGYRSNGDRVAFTLSVLWDVIADPASPYQNPIFRAGFFL